MTALGDDIRGVQAELTARAAELGTLAASVDALGSGGSSSITWPPASNLIGGTQPSAPTLVSGDTDSGAVNLVYYDRLCDAMPDGSVMFFGHSQVQAMPVCAASPFGINLGYGAQSTRRLIHYMLRSQTKSALQRAGAGVILCPGCVDASNTGYYGSYAGSVSSVVYMFNSLIKPWITGKWAIILPLPGDQRVSGIPSAYNQTMLDIGTGVSNAFAGVSGVVIINPWASMVDGTGNLAAVNHNGDGQHLSKVGNAIVTAAVKTALQGLGVGG